MKKTIFLTGVALLLFTALTHAQTDTTAPSVTAKAVTDQWNNYSPDKYKMLPMPEALTTDKIFPVIGHYAVTAKDGAASTVTITLDEANKGIAWVAGLPQGKFRATLRKSPSTYKIPAQKLEDGKELAEGVLIYNKETNTLDVCIGCTYNNEDPAAAFTAPEPVVEQQPAANKGKGKNKNATAKVIPVKTWKYSGTKTAESTASVSMQ